jgi:hypothetical protein
MLLLWLLLLLLLLLLPPTSPLQLWCLGGIEKNPTTIADPFHY